MNLYFAPMEGITTYTYRNTHAELFGMCDMYFTPFMVPTEQERITRKTLREILIENNSARITPQILCCQEEAFLKFTKKIRELGYDEVNLNLGCPSGTVVKKNRGSGALKNPEELNRFLEQIFSLSNFKVSVKTRAGFYDHSEFDKLLGIFNCYPISELIIHPRVREEYYNGVPNMQTFDKAYQNSHLKLCYNGNIVTLQDYENISEAYSRLNSVMIGRGAVRNPAIFREIKGGKPLRTEELVSFSNVLEKRYLKILGSEVYTLHKLKEIWIHMMQNFPDEKKLFKAVKKSNRLSELNNALSWLPEIK